MDRNREARRGTTAAVNGGVHKRRQRSSSLRDSPDEDGAIEMPEMGRLRDRGGKKDRDRDRSSRNKRRRGDRMLHGGNREEGEDTSEESVEDDEEEDDDEPGAPAPMRLQLPPPSSLLPNPSSSTSSLPPNHHHRKSFPSKVVRAPPLWKVTDEMIGVSVPRKARSSTASTKRSHECWISGGGAGGGGGGGGGVSGSGEPMNHHRQNSTSPARLSPASTAPISPSSSNPPVRKKMKQISGTKHRPPKTVKSPSSVQDIEIEVAEVLFGMTRQFQSSSKQEAQRLETKEANGSGGEAKSRVSSPNSTPLPNSSSTAASLPAVVAPKRKRPRPVSNAEEGSSTTQTHQIPPKTISSKVDGDQTTKTEVPSPKLEKSTPSSVVENGSASVDLALPQASSSPRDAPQESSKQEAISDSKPPVPEVAPCDATEPKEVASSSSKKGHDVESEANRVESPPPKAAVVADGSREEKFKIDLMAPPPTKSSPEAEISTEFSADHKLPPAVDTVVKRSDAVKAEDSRLERVPKSEMQVEPLGEAKTTVEKSSVLDLESKDSTAKERPLDLHLDIEKTDEDVLSSSKLQSHRQQQSKLTKTEKGQATSMQLSMGVAGWPGGLPPPIGYMGQVPSLQAAFPMDGSNGGSKVMQSPPLPPRTKRCATHCCIAQNIHYHQQLARMNPFWAAAAPGSVPLFGAKPYNPNTVPPSESILAFPGRGLGTMPDKSGPVAAAFGGHSSKDKNSVANNFLDAQQRKPLGVQLPPQGTSTSNMMHPPAFILPLNQQHAAAAAAARSGAVKPPSNAGVGVAPASSNAPSPAPAGSGMSAASAPMVSFNYANLPSNEAQYLAILQNNGYSFPIPAPVGATPQYRGNHVQAIPFFNGPFYTSQMLHPSQLQPQAHSTQHGHQNTSTSSGSTSSQKHQQQQQRTTGAPAASTSASHGLPTGMTRQHLPPHNTSRQLDVEAVDEESPAGDGRASHIQKGAGTYAPNFTVPFNPQEYAMMAHAAAVGGGGGTHTDKHHPPVTQQQNMKIDLAQSQPFALSYATFNGAAGPAIPPPGLDFSSIAQGHLFQSVPEAARHGYPVAAAAASQHKKPHHLEDGKSLAATGDSAIASAPNEDDNKIASTGKVTGGFSQQSFSFSRPDGDASMVTAFSNNVIDSSRTLNLIPAAVNGSRPSSALPSTTGVLSSNSAHSNLNQHQQHLVQMQMRKQQQQPPPQVQLQQLAPRTKPVTSSSSANIYPDRLPSGSVVTKFPNDISGFPPTLIQGSAPVQTSQWKNSGQTAGGSSGTSAKNQLPQQQSRTSQPVLSGHQMQISFTSNSQKAPSNGQRLAGLSNSTSSPVAVCSPQASVSKSAGGSPKSSSGSKAGAIATTLPLQQQQPTPNKASPAASSRKSSPVNNRNVPSILGNQHMPASGQNSSCKTHQSQQQQFQKHSYPQPQIFFSNAYLQMQSPQANAAAGYYQRRPGDQQQQQQQPPPNPASSSTTGMPSLCQPTSSTHSSGNATSDPAKAVAAAAAAAASSMKGLPPTSLLQSAQLAAAAQGGSHAVMSVPGFPYVPAMPSISAKQAEQKKTGAGNENLHACWQSEKR